MKRFVVTLLPECLDDYFVEDNPARVVDAFVEELDLQAFGFEGRAQDVALLSGALLSPRGDSRADRISRARGLGKLLVGCAVDRCLKTSQQVAAYALAVDAKDDSSAAFCAIA
jgi:hypothetical protein